MEVGPALCLPVQQGCSTDDRCSYQKISQGVNHKVPSTKLCKCYEVKREAQPSITEFVVHIVSFDVCLSFAQFSFQSPVPRCRMLPKGPHRAI